MGGKIDAVSEAIGELRADVTAIKNSVASIDNYIKAQNGRVRTLENDFAFWKGKAGVYGAIAGVIVSVFVFLGQRVIAGG